MKTDTQYDVAVIGAGVSGAAIARRLSAYQLHIALVEKECDVSFGVSKANSGIIHGGFHHSPDTLKSRLEVQGNLLYDTLHKQLHFPFRRCGILVAAFTSEEMRTVEALYENGVQNEVIGIELCNRERMLYLEPKLNTDIVGGLHAPGGGIIEPYRFVFTLVESAQQNGVDLLTGFNVIEAKCSGGQYEIEAEDTRKIQARWVINAAGLYADTVSKIFGAEDFVITPRKGEEFLLDRDATAHTSRVIFPVPGRVSKGMLVIPTVEGTTMVGPTAQIQDDKEDAATSSENFEKVFYGARRLVPSVSERDIITSFAGLRPAMEGNDFYIALSKKAENLVQVAGIQSPGLTAAPAIAEYVKDILKEAGLPLQEKPGYIPEIDRLPRFRESLHDEIDVLIRENPHYGEIICRCEQISAAEIIDAVRKGHTTLDGVKFYTRAQMGRCQGGFCTYKILKLIEQETGTPVERITKRGKESRMVTHRIGDFTVQKDITDNVPEQDGLR
ncbi:MAG: NAD(P)/FAD-dependent oxidoreductase [Spirochaetota bacterium]